MALYLLSNITWHPIIAAYDDNVTNHNQRKKEDLSCLLSLLWLVCVLSVVRQKDRQQQKREANIIILHISFMQ